MESAQILHRGTCNKMFTSATLLGPPHLRNFFRFTKWPPSFNRTLCSSHASLARVPTKVLPGADTCASSMTHIRNCGQAGVAEREAVSAALNSRHWFCASALAQLHDPADGQRDMKHLKGGGDVCCCLQFSVGCTLCNVCSRVSFCCCVR